MLGVVQPSWHPDCLVTDNGSYIVAEGFREFTTAWKLKHVTSFPPYPKSNGKAESAVKIVKENTERQQRSMVGSPRVAQIPY